MPSTSEKQADMMAKAAHNSHYAEAVGVDQKTAWEFHRADVAAGRPCAKCAGSGKKGRIHEIK